VDSHEAIDNGSAVNGVNGGTDVDSHDDGSNVNG